MSSLSHILWRLIAVALGWLLAVIASVAVVLVAAALAVPPAAQAFADTPENPILAGLTVLATRGLRALALGPALVEIAWPGWLLAALLAEIAAGRSLLVHLAGAAVIAVGAFLATTPSPDAASVQLVLAAGLVAGFTHWLVAGRSAGLTPPVPRHRNGGGDPRPPHA